MLVPCLVIFEVDAILDNPPQGIQAEYLKATGIAQDRLLPGAEGMKTACLLDEIMARPEIKVVGVGEDDLGSTGVDLVPGQRFHGGVSTDRHEYRCVNQAV